MEGGSRKGGFVRTPEPPLVTGLYADNHRQARLHDLRHGDLVIAKQAKGNRFTIPYDPVPYKVVNTKGSMVTAEKLTGDKLLTRNSSHFKKIVKAEDVNVHAPVIDDDPVEEEEEERRNFIRQLEGARASTGL